MSRIERLSDPQAYVQQSRLNALLGWKACDILKADKVQLLTMQHRLALGKTWGTIEIPMNLMPHGRFQNSCDRIHRLSEFLPRGVALDDPIAEKAWTEVLRFAVCRLTIPGPTRSDVVTYSTCAQNVRTLKRVVEKVLEKPVKKGHFWSLVNKDELPATDVFVSIIRLLSHYCKRGALSDEIRVLQPVQADEAERDRIDEPEYSNSVDENRQWQPLPLEFVSQAGWRSVRIVRSIAPTLLDAWEAALQVPLPTSGSRGMCIGLKRSKELARYARDQIIAHWDWRDERGESLRELGFDFHLKVCVHQKSSKKLVYEDLQWPPKTCAQVMSFAHALIKPAQLWMVLLGNGNRNGEVVSMRTNCLTPTVTGDFTWKGRTYKMAGIVGGRENKAVVPELIGQSILQQIRLAKSTRLTKGWRGNALWVGYKSEDQKDLSILLNKYVDHLGLRSLLGQENPSCHEHRFRKTLARLVALALTNSIMILKDCFGHTDAVMTLLSYIESDPTITQEVIKVQKELSIMMAVDVITNAETVGGPGAPALRKRAEDHLKRIGKSKFDPQNAYEFARRETFDGRSWMLVAPGVVCTAPHGSIQVATPCASGQPQHNPANCKTGCEWQLLLNGFEKTQADDTVEFALMNLQRVLDDEDEAGIAMWKGQAKTWLYRYDEVADKWKNHPLVLIHVPPPLRVIKKNET
jgi:integrase